MVARALVSAGVPATKEPVSISRRNGKRLDGMTQIPWRWRKLLVWDVTVVSTLAQSYVAAAARGRGEVAKLAAARKCEKYAKLSTAYTFLPIAVEALGPMNESAYRFFEDLDRRICDVTGDICEVPFIFQRLSVTIQRFNAALYRETFALHNDSDL